MKLRTKLRLAYAVWFALGFLLLWLSVSISQWFLLGLFSFFIGVGAFVFSQKCPNCAKPVLNNPLRIFGMEIWLATPWMPKQCSRCGHDLE